MSAYQVTPKHIAAIVGSTMAAPFNHAAAQHMAETLAQANADGIDARYPGPSPTPPVVVDDAEMRRYHAKPLKPVALLKALTCLEYQCCEAQGWEGTEACKTISMIRAGAVVRLAGYSEAAWDIR